jgi:hypothetical protein
LGTLGSNAKKFKKYFITLQTVQTGRFAQHRGRIGLIFAYLAILTRNWADWGLFVAI